MTKLIPIKSFTQENYEQSKNKYIFGKVLWYVHKKGYGFIYTEYGTELFLSAWAIPKANMEYSLHIGTIVKFKVKQREGRNDFCADDLSIVEHWPNGLTLDLPNNISIPYKKIRFIYYCEGKDFIKQLGLEDKVPDNYDLNTLNHISIITFDFDKYRFFDYSASVTGDGKCNLEELRYELKHKIYDL